MNGTPTLQAGEPSHFYLHILSTIRDKRSQARFMDRRRLLAVAAGEHGWNQIAVCSSLTGDPTQFLEVYDYQGTESVSTAKQHLENHPFFQEMVPLSLERKATLLSRLPYAPHTPPPRESIDRQHFLHVSLTVKDGRVDLFSLEMQKVMDTFVNEVQWQLVAAGESLCPPYPVMHLWALKDANMLDSLMLMLAEDDEYVWINNNTVQRQDLMHGIFARPPHKPPRPEGSP
jgi:hypothetical protein